MRLLQKQVLKCFKSKTSIWTILRTVVDEIWLLKMVDLNVKGNKSFSPIISVEVSNVRMHMTTNCSCVVMPNKMLCLYSSAWFCAWFLSMWAFRKWYVVCQIFISHFNNMFSYTFMKHPVKSNKTNSNLYICWIVCSW